MGLVIGLCGIPGGGKTEVRKILVKDHGFEDINSKLVINQLAEVATGIPAHKFSDPFYKDELFEGHSLRSIAAQMGMAVENLFGQDYLIREAMKQHRVKERPEKNFVIDSLRMNQPLLLQGELTVVEVLSNKATGTPYNFDKYLLPKGHCQIHNLHTPGDLQYRVKTLLISLESKNHGK